MVKLVYIILIVLVFGAGLFVSFDTYVSSSVFEKKYFKDAAPMVNSSGNTLVTAKTGLFKIPYYDFYYNNATKCVSTIESGE